MTAGFFGGSGFATGLGSGAGVGVATGAGGAVGFAAGSGAGAGFSGSLAQPASKKPNATQHCGCSFHVALPVVFRLPRGFGFNHSVHRKYKRFSREN